MKKYIPLLLILFIPAVLKAQTDSVTKKISRIPFLRVDVQAKFPGEAFEKYIAGHIQLSKNVRENLKGQVITSMKINQDGSVTNVGILKSLSPQIDREVIRVINSSPKWEPAVLNGQKVSVYMVLNIDLSVKNDKELAAQQTTPLATSNKPIDTLKPKITSIRLPPPPEKTPPALSQKPVFKAEVKKPAVPAAQKAVVETTKPAIQAAQKKPLVAAVKIRPPVKTTQPAIVKKPLIAEAKKAVPPVVKKPVALVPPIQKPVIAVKIKTPVKPVNNNAAAAKINKPSEVKKAVKPIPKKPTIRLANKTAGRDTSYEPEFPGGMQEFYNYLAKNIRYPPNSKKNNIEGVAKIMFVIEKDGRVDHVEIQSAPAEDLGLEAARVLASCPRWKPGMQSGKPVRVFHTVPINFQLRK